MSNKNEIQNLLDEIHFDLIHGEINFSAPTNINDIGNLLIVSNTRHTMATLEVYQPNVKGALWTIKVTVIKNGDEPKRKLVTSRDWHRIMGELKKWF